MWKMLLHLHVNQNPMMMMMIIMILVLFQALDADSSPNVQYVLSGTNSEDFRIDTFNGVGSIQVNQPLDYETRASYNLFITTTDGQNSNIPGTSANVFIEVLVRYVGHLFEAYKLKSYIMLGILSAPSI